MSDPLGFAERARIKCDISTNNTTAVDALTSSAPITYRAAALYWELGLFLDANTIVSDFTDFVSLTFRVVDKATRKQKIYEKTILKADLDSITITKADWDTKAHDKAHAVIFMSSADTNLAITAVQDFKQAYTVLVIVNWTDGDGNAAVDVAAKFDWQIEEADIQDTLPAIGGTNPNFKVLGDGRLAVANEDATKHYVPWIDDTDPDNPIMRWETP